jgi:hypothetical protein
MSTETKTETSHWHSGYNMIGYLPNNDGPTFVFDTFNDARMGLIAELDQILDLEAPNAFEQDEYAEIRALDYGQLHQVYDELVENATGPEWGSVAGLYAYWIEPCSNTCEIE